MSLRRARLAPRRVPMRCPLLLSLLALAGCYNPQLPSGRFTCATTDQCPEQLVCAGGLCVEPGRDLAGTSSDLAGGPSQDLAGSPPDLASDPCANGWIELAAPTVYACRRTFSISNGSWGGLCRGGFHVCEARDSAALSTAGLAGRCNAAGRAFVARIDATLSNVSSTPRAGDPNCSPSGDGRHLLACGSDSELYSLRNGGCSGLQQTMSCFSEPEGWGCSNSSGVNGSTSYSGSQGGVLCCKDS